MRFLPLAGSSFVEAVSRAGVRVAEPVVRALIGVLLAVALLFASAPLHAQAAPPVQPRPGEAKPGEAKPGEAKPGEAKPGEAKPGEAKPGEPGGAKPGEPGTGEPTTPDTKKLRAE